jgi:hypothetical protein
MTLFAVDEVFGKVFAFAQKITVTLHQLANVLRSPSNSRFPPPHLLEPQVQTRNMVSVVNFPTGNVVRIAVIHEIGLNTVTQAFYVTLETRGRWGPVHQNNSLALTSIHVGHFGIEDFHALAGIGGGGR